MIQLFKNFFRYLVIWLAQIRYSIIREMVFKGNFFLWISVELVWFAMQLIFVEVVFGHVNSVAGWTHYEMVMLVGTNQVIQQLFQATLMVNCFNLPELIRTGKFDFYLAQPASAQFLLSTRMFDLGGLVNGFTGLVVCFYAALQLQMSFSFSKFALFLCWIGCGILIHYSLLLLLVTLSFWIIRSQGLIYGYYNLFQISRIPRSAFKGAAKVIFTYAIPMLLVANVPCETLLGRENPWFGFLLATITLIFVGISACWFNYGLRHYSSASS